MKTKINFLDKEYEIELVLSHYNYKNRIAIQAIDMSDGEPFGTLTTNIEEDVEENEFFVKDWSENSSWVPQVLEEFPEYFENTGKKFQSGFVQVPVWKLKKTFN